MSTTLSAKRTAVAPQQPRPRPRRLPLVITVLVVTAGIVLRFVSSGPLWLDEAQSVAIARLPFDRLIHALTEDGSPPLYYLVLHAWMAVFGTGTFAVRALSGLFGVGAIPAVGMLATRVLPGEGQLPALLLIASSPFALRFATEARMYSLVILLVALGGLALARLWRRPTWSNALLFGVVAAALSVTHYWCDFLLLVVAGGSGWRALRGSRPARLTLAGMLVTAVPFGWWLPHLVFQVEHTGTPWAHAAWYSVLQAFPNWAGADLMDVTVIIPAAGLLPLLLGTACLGAVRVRAARVAGAIVVATLAVAGATSVVLRAAIVPRYTAVGLVPFLLAVTAGIVVLSPRVRNLLLGTAVLLGLVTGYLNTVAPRTRAGVVAAVLRRHGRPANVLVYCPDQLGPDTDRLLPGWRHQSVFPNGGSAGRVDWVNYTARNRRGSPERFARHVVRRAGSRPIWLYRATHYPSYGARCSQLGNALARLTDHRHRFFIGTNPMNPAQVETLTRYR